MAFQQLQQLPGTLVRTGLQAARLPLNAAESVLRRGEQSGEWAPAIAFDGIEASVKRVAGSLLRDDTLVQEGRLEQAKVDKLRKAARLEAIAREHEQAADTEYRQRVQTDEQRRAQVAKQADQQETALERQRAARERAAEEEARRKAESAQKVDAAAKKAVEKNARNAAPPGSRPRPPRLRASARRSRPRRTWSSSTRSSAPPRRHARLSPDDP